MIEKAIDELQKRAAKAASDANEAESRGSDDMAPILDAREQAFREAVGVLKSLQLETEN
jgi:hypothetical protein